MSVELEICLSIYLSKYISMRLEITCFKILWTWVKLAANSWILNKSSNQIGFDRFHFKLTLILNKLRESVPDLGNLFRVLIKDLSLELLLHNSTFLRVSFHLFLGMIVCNQLNDIQLSHLSIFDFHFI